MNSFPDAGFVHFLGICAGKFSDMETSSLSSFFNAGSTLLDPFGGVNSGFDGAMTTSSGNKHNTLDFYTQQHAKRLCLDPFEGYTAGEGTSSKSSQSFKKPRGIMKYFSKGRQNTTLTTLSKSDLPSAETPPTELSQPKQDFYPPDGKLFYEETTPNEILHIGCGDESDISLTADDILDFDCSDYDASVNDDGDDDITAADISGDSSLLNLALSVWDDVEEKASDSSTNSNQHPSERVPSNADLPGKSNFTQTREMAPNSTQSRQETNKVSGREDSDSEICIVWESNTTKPATKQQSGV